MSVTGSEVRLLGKRLEDRVILFEIDLKKLREKQRRRAQRRRDNCETAIHIILVLLAWTGIAWLYNSGKMDQREAGILMVGVFALSIWLRRDRQR